MYNSIMLGYSSSVRSRLGVRGTALPAMARFGGPENRNTSMPRRFRPPTDGPAYH